jgi:hypothetical protein
VLWANGADDIGRDATKQPARIGALSAIRMKRIIATQHARNAADLHAMARLVAVQVRRCVTPRSD